MMKKNFWNKKKVLITGINGFVGGNICKELISLGANVTGLIRNKNKKTLLFLEKLNPRLWEKYNYNPYTYIKLLDPLLIQQKLKNLGMHQYTLKQMPNH